MNEGWEKSRSSVERTIIILMNKTKMMCVSTYQGLLNFVIFDKNANFVCAYDSGMMGGAGATLATVLFSVPTYSE